MPVLFAVTLFVSATLLFLVQPMIAKMILPKLGGTPAVWNTCMVFFQAALLAGYAYAHITTTRLGVRRQALWHCVLLVLPLIVLPIAVSAQLAPPADANPIPWVLGLLIVSAGLPFFFVSTSAPLLQKWFAATGHPSAKDPYFLYAASNVGSMLALVAYPALLEPSFRLADQSRYWALGYCAFVLLTAACAFVVWRSPYAVQEVAESAAPEDRSDAPSAWKQLHWVALAFVPSSLMLGATTYLSTDIAPIPLIWVIPLALYLLSFILVFARLPEFVRQGVILILPVVVLLQLYLTYSGTELLLQNQIALHLVMLFLVAMACHGELARQRPATRYLTGFYLWMSLGGVLGGMFNALLAPLIFKDISEYTLVLVFACLLLPQLDDEKPSDSEAVSLAPDAPLWKVLWWQATWPWRQLNRLDRRTGILTLGLPLLLAWATFRGLEFFDSKNGREFIDNTHKWLVDLRPKADWITLGRVRSALRFGLPVLLCYALVTRPLRFGLGVAAIMLANNLYLDAREEGNADSYNLTKVVPQIPRVLMQGPRQPDVLYGARSFFGVLKVEHSGDDENGYNRLLHGTTLHGMQRCEFGRPQHNCEPLTYYGQSGPVGELFSALAKLPGASRPMGVVGLGTGTLACYARTGQELTFFEIDAEVVRIAEDPRLFTNLQDARDRGVDVHVQMGDARLSLQGYPDGHFRILLIDAFSSDAIPVHLITREALQLYMRKLTPDGVVVFHISNRYLNLEPVLANLMEAEGLKGGVVMHGEESGDPAACASTWVPIARNDADLGKLIYHTEATEQTRLLDFVRLAGSNAGGPLTALAPLALLDEPDGARLGRDWYRVGDERHRKKRIDSKRVGVWSDDYCNILSIFSWRDDPE